MLSEEMSSWKWISTYWAEIDPLQATG